MIVGIRAYKIPAKSELDAFRAQVDAVASINCRQLNTTDNSSTAPTVFTNVFNGYDATDAVRYVLILHVGFVLIRI